MLHSNTLQKFHDEITPNIYVIFQEYILRKGFQKHIKYSNIANNHTPVQNG